MADVVMLYPSSTSSVIESPHSISGREVNLFNDPNKMSLPPPSACVVGPIIFATTNTKKIFQHTHMYTNEKFFQQTFTAHIYLFIEFVINAYIARVRGVAESLTFSTLMTTLTRIIQRTMSSYTVHQIVAVL